MVCSISLFIPSFDADFVLVQHQLCIPPQAFTFVFTIYFSSFVCTVQLWPYQFITNWLHPPSKSFSLHEMMFRLFQNHEIFNRFSSSALCFQSLLHHDIKYFRNAFLPRFVLLAFQNAGDIHLRTMRTRSPAVSIPFEEEDEGNTESKWQTVAYILVGSRQTRRTLYSPYRPFCLGWLGCGAKLALELHRRCKIVPDVTKSDDTLATPSALHLTSIHFIADFCVLLLLLRQINCPIISKSTLYKLIQMQQGITI
jgi:hypothetical protein